MSTTLPDGIRELLANRIDSFEKLEMILALHGAPRTTLSVEEMCRRLNLTRDVVRQATMELRGASLVVLTSTGDIQLLPLSEADDAILAQLVQLYEHDRLTVVKAMGEIALDRIRNIASRAFAGAFVSRKKPPDDGNDG